MPKYFPSNLFISSKIKFRFIALVVISFFSMCVQAGDFFIPPPPDDIPLLPDTALNEVYRVEQVEAVIPPHPGASGGSPVIPGADTDNDGIRDDVELYIYGLKSSDADLAIYGKDTDFNNKYLRNSLYNIAFFYQKLMTAPEGMGAGYYIPPDDYRNSFYAGRKCLANRVGASTDYSTLVNKIDNLMLSNFERLSKYYYVQESLIRIVQEVERDYQNQPRQRYVGTASGKQYDVWGFIGCAGYKPESIIR